MALDNEGTPFSEDFSKETPHEKSKRVLLTNPVRF